MACLFGYSCLSVSDKHMKRYWHAQEEKKYRLHQVACTCPFQEAWDVSHCIQTTSSKNIQTRLLWEPQLSSLSSLALVSVKPSQDLGARLSPKTMYALPWCCRHCSSSLGLGAMFEGYIMLLYRLYVIICYNVTILICYIYYIYNIFEGKVGCVLTVRS